MSDPNCKWCGQPMYQMAAHTFCGNCDRADGPSLPPIDHYSGV